MTKTVFMPLPDEVHSRLRQILIKYRMTWKDFGEALANEIELTEEILRSYIKAKLSIELREISSPSIEVSKFLKRTKK